MLRLDFDAQLGSFSPKRKMKFGRVKHLFKCSVRFLRNCLYLWFSLIWANLECSFLELGFRILCKGGVVGFAGVEGTLLGFVVDLFFKEIRASVKRFSLSAVFSKNKLCPKWYFNFLVELLRFDLINIGGNRIF